jgi:hypothetical protein
MNKNILNNVKQVNPTPYSKEVYFSIVEYIKLNSKLPSMSISKQARNKYISKLKRAGILIKLGYGVWGVDDDKWEQFSFISKVIKQKEVNSTPNTSKQHLSKKFTSKDIRGHGFIITFEIPKIAGWYKREQFFKSKDIEYKKVGLNDSGIRVIVRDHKIQLYKKSIVIYSPSHLSYFSDTAEESYKYAIYDLQQILKQLEKLMQTSFKIDGTYKFRVSRQHYGKINDSLSKMYKRNGERLYVANDKGVWLITDNSLNMNETETTHKITAQKDMDKIVIPFFNDLKDHYETTGETLTISKLMKISEGILKNQIHATQHQEFNQELLKQIIKKLE